jgi:hypothetical protein
MGGWCSVFGVWWGWFATAGDGFRIGFHAILAGLWRLGGISSQYGREVLAFVLLSCWCAV